MTGGLGGLAGQFFGFFFIADFQVELGLSLAGDAAGFADLFLEGVLVVIGNRLIGEEFGLVLVEGLDLNWSGPPGVIALSADADVSLSY